jgi:hypothetical protein
MPASHWPESVRMSEAIQVQQRLQGRFLGHVDSNIGSPHHPAAQHEQQAPVPPEQSSVGLLVTCPRSDDQSPVTCGHVAELGSHLDLSDH